MDSFSVAYARLLKKMVDEAAARERESILNTHAIENIEQYRLRVGRLSAFEEVSGSLMIAAEDEINRQTT